MDMNGLNQNSYKNTPVSDYRGTSKSSAASGTKGVGGRTVGDPKLSDKALKYYDDLKKKYSNMEFVLVSPDKKEEAERNKASYGSSKELLVLIDSDKIEQMASDESYRKKYEAILSNATSQITQMKSSLGKNASKVSSFGMTFDKHGSASFFAVIDKSLLKQKERIAARKVENAKTQKAADKKAEEKRTEKKANAKKADGSEDEEDSVTVTASSWEELLRKIDSTITSNFPDNTWTDEEKAIGQSVDYTA